jgi:RNA polymerase-binding transcription factor DksA
VVETEAADLIGTQNMSEPAGSPTPEERVDTVDQVLDEVEHALSRLDDATYGLCESCGATIDDARLAHEPATRACGECSAQGDG